MKRWLLNPEVRPVWGSGDEAALLAAYERVWERKRILPAMYETWYRWIMDELRPGNVLEIGAGTGNFKRWLRGRKCWTLDILPGEHVDVQADALRPPFRPASVDNIVMIDVLHHLAQPVAFLNQAATVLRGGGRVLLVEPFVSVWSWFVYKFLHHERVDFGFCESDAIKAAWDGNAAIPQLVLGPKYRSQLELRIVKISYGEFLSYPLCGGFSYRALLPDSWLLGLHNLEQSRLFRNRLVALRQFVILEKGA